MESIYIYIYIASAVNRVHKQTKVMKMAAMMRKMKTVMMPKTINILIHIIKAQEDKVTQIGRKTGKKATIF